MRNFTEYLKRKNREYSNFDASDLNSNFIHAYETNKRIEVAFKDKDGNVYETKRGRIGISTGWKPVFLLMLTVRSIGSSYTIGKNDYIVKYV